MVKGVGPVGTQKVYRVLQTVWKYRVIPCQWRKGRIVPCHKKGDKLCKNYSFERFGRNVWE
jgi:hypothetical protein